MKTLRYIYKLSGARFSVRNMFLAIILFGSVLVAVIWAGVYFKLESERKYEIEDARKQTANYARAFEENTLRTIKSADQVAVILKFQYERQGPKVDMAPFMLRGDLEVPDYVLLSVADENGDLVASNQEPFVFSNIGDREHFLVHRDADTGKPFISAPIMGRSSGKWAIQVTRRINKVDGSFGGVVIVSLDPYYFTRFYEQIDLGESSSIALIRTDGMVLAWQSTHGAFVGLDFSDRKVVKLARQKAEGQFDTSSVVDGVARIYSYRASPEYPIIVAVGVAENEALAGYYERRSGYIAIAFCLSLFILGFCAMLIGRILARQRSETMQYVLYKIAATANSSASLQDFCGSLHTAVKELLPAECFFAALWDDEQKTLHPVYQVNKPNCPACGWGVKDLPEQVARTGQLVVVNRAAGSRSRDGDDEKTASSVNWLGAPLKLDNNKVFGVMAIYGCQKRKTYGIRDQRLFAFLSSQVAIAIERLRAEKELRKFSRVVEQSPVSVVITDANGDIEYVNPMFVETTGYEAAEVIGENPRLLNSDRHPPEFFRMMWDALLNCNAWHGEICNRKKNGDIYWEKASISPVRNPFGEITHFVGIKEDITDQKRLENDLLQAKEAAETASRAKSVFLANMSHEIRTPMNAVLGFVQLLQREPELTPRQRQYIDTIDDAGKHLLTIINNVLEMSKIEAGRSTLNPTVFDVNALLDDVARILRARLEAKGLEFVVEQAGEGPLMVMADEGKLRQVLLNLLGNAVKFTQEGGIILRALIKQEQAETLCLHLEVEDTGPGIEAEDLDRLFQSFEQTQTGRDAGTGTGLGLAISRNFIRQMGGDITVKSEVGLGSVFGFDLILAKADPEEEAVRKEVRHVTGIASGEPRWRVLIADDVASGREILHQLLERVGFQTRVTADGKEAVDEYLSWHPDLILMDMHMPGMDGYEAIRKIRVSGVGQGVPIIAVTASAFEEERQRIIAAGASDFLRKPFQETDLFQKIQALLGVEYVYDDAQTSEMDEQGVVAAQRLTPEAIKLLPRELVRELHGAVVDGDYYLILEIIDRLTAGDANLAAELRNMAQRFDFQRLGDLLTEEGDSQ